MSKHTTQGIGSEVSGLFPELAVPIAGKRITDDALRPPALDASDRLIVAIGSGGGGAVTIADGADVAEGATTDAAVVTDTTGTISGKLRGLVKWAFERMPASLGQKLMALSFPVVIASDQSNVPVTVFSMPANTTSTGTITAVAQTVSITVPPGGSAIGIEITGTWTGQIEFEATIDGITYFPVYASSTSTSTNATQGNGVFVLPGAGFQIVRTRSSSWSSGTAAVAFNASIGTAGTILSAPLPTGTNSIGQVTANAGTNLNTSLLALETGGNLAAIAASASVLDDWDESDRAKVNPIVGQAGVQGGSGGVTALTQRVVLATDVPLPAGTNTLGAVSSKIDLTPSSPTAATVGVASAQAVAASASRKGLVLINTSANYISLGFGAAAVLYSGITLNPSGGTFVMDEFMFDVGAVNAIASAASSNLAIQEYV